MALIMSSFSLKVQKDSNGDLKVIACYVKGSSESSDLRSYAEQSIVPDESTAAELSAAYDALKAAVKTEQNLE